MEDYFDKFNKFSLMPFIYDNYEITIMDYRRNELLLKYYLVCYVIDIRNIYDIDIDKFKEKKIDLIKLIEDFLNRFSNLLDIKDSNELKNFISNINNKKISDKIENKKEIIKKNKI